MAFRRPSSSQSSKFQPPRSQPPRSQPSRSQLSKSQLPKSPSPSIQRPKSRSPTSPRHTAPFPLPLNPWIAVNLSVIWPGIGQVYGRATIKGILLAIATVTLLIYSGWSLFAADGNTLTGLLVIVVLAALYIANLFDAYNTIRPLPKASPKDIYPPTQNRWYAIFLSQILPGFGHLYFQQAVMGGLFLGIGVLIAYLANFHPMLLPLPPIVWAIACYHLYRTTPHSSSTQRPATQHLATQHLATQRPPSPSPKRRPRPPKANQDWAIAIVIAGLLVVRLTVGYIPASVNRALLQCIVPSRSMEPTLQIDDRLFVQRDAQYRPQLGDLVVFRAPVEAIATLDIDVNTLFVKRVIGLPSQAIAIKNGQILIDQVPLNEPYEASVPAYQWGPAVIPPNTYFVLGDNRNDSADSHVWGFLPIEDILGKAYKIYWPPERIQPLSDGKVHP